MNNAPENTQTHKHIPTIIIVRKFTFARNFYDKFTICIFTLFIILLATFIENLFVLVIIPCWK